MTTPADPPGTWPADTLAALAKTARPFPQAMTPPGIIYRDPAIFRHELTVVFERQWLCIGHQSRLEQSGDFSSVDIGSESIIVVRDENGDIRAFHNVCRHRGTRVCATASGNTRGFVCPYHAWHYDLNGRLKAAPGMDAVDGFSRDDYPLTPVRLERILGFLFVNLSGDAEPLSSYFGDFPSLDEFRLPELNRVARHHYDVAANWKLICENYHECYHCRGAHPQLHRISGYDNVDNDGFSGNHFVGGPMSIRNGFNTMTESGQTSRAALAGEQADRRLVHYFNLLPNFLLSIAPDYVVTHHIWPRDALSCYIESEWFFNTEQMNAPDFDPSDAIQFWDLTNRQDWALCENAQRGLQSSAHRQGRYHGGEDCTHRFARWYIRHAFPDLG